MQIVMFGILLTVFTMTSFAQVNPPDSVAKVLKSAEYELSDEAILAGIDGRLSVSITVTKAGVVKNPMILAGPAWPCNSNPKKEIDQVRKEVKQTLMATTFSPAVKNGKPFESELYLTFIIGEAYKREVKKREEADAAKKGIAAPKIVQGGVINGKALSLPRPEYPFAAKTARAGGTVTVEILIGENGNVIRAGAFNGPPALQDAARDAACKARFSPTSLAENPVKVSGVVTYNFVP